MAFRKSYPMRLSAFTLIILLVLSACAPVPAPTPAPTVPPLPEGVRPLDPPVALPDFTLTDQGEQPFTLQNFRDRWTVLSFGYTHCPDVCPIMLANFTLVKRALGDQADKIAFMFVSVDGARDTPAVMRRHLANFDPTFLGLTGDENAVRPLAQAFGVRYEIVKPEGTQAEYLINHTASSFLVNPKGELARIYSYGTDPEVIAADLKALIAN
jgi:protein SCO1/2